MRILVLNPNTSESFTATIRAVAEKYKSPGTEVVATNPRQGPRSIESVYDELLSAQASLEALISCESQFDGFVVACYGNETLVQAMREITRKPVLGIAEASFYTACMLGHRFSVVTTGDRWGPLLWAVVRHYGLADRCASIRPSGLAVLELESSRDEKVRQRVLQEAHKAVDEDGADVICLGCAGMAGLDKELESGLGVPVVDGVVSAVKLIEALVGYGVGTSKRCIYAPLSSKELLNMPALFTQPYR